MNGTAFFLLLVVEKCIMNYALCIMNYELCIMH